MIITLEDIKKNKDVKTMISWSNHCLEAIGYTDHGLRHASYVSRVASEILRQLDHPKRMVELAAISGWVHDIGNCINRKNHGLTGANLIFPILVQMGMPIEEICVITSAVGNHEEEHGNSISEVSAALIIADKSDAHRARVRRGKCDLNDIHDRVNYSIKHSKVVVDKEAMVIKYELDIDKNSSVMEFLQIYMSRMVMSEKAANYLGCSFEIVANGLTLNNNFKGCDMAKESDTASETA
ncbi:MAG: phosphohydrolase [Mahellales bacterium]|jgi:metal-dependent HD superfamily phosphatase/phosphodiesterase